MSLNAYKDFAQKGNYGNGMPCIFVVLKLQQLYYFLIDIWHAL